MYIYTGNMVPTTSINTGICSKIQSGLAGLPLVVSTVCKGVTLIFELMNCYLRTALFQPASANSKWWDCWSDRRHMHVSA